MAQLREGTDMVLAEFKVIADMVSTPRPEALEVELPRRATCPPSRRMASAALTSAPLRRGSRA